MITRITSWTANSECLEISVWIKPWDKVAYYRRLLVNGTSGYSREWKWVDGGMGSSQMSWVNTELHEILNELVLSHDVLNWFCRAYGIEVGRIE